MDLNPRQSSDLSPALPLARRVLQTLGCWIKGGTHLALGNIFQQHSANLTQIHEHFGDHGNCNFQQMYWLLKTTPGSGWEGLGGASAAKGALQWGPANTDLSPSLPGQFLFVSLRTREATYQLLRSVCKHLQVGTEPATLMFGLHVSVLPVH